MRTWIENYCIAELINSFISEIYIAPLEDGYSEALPAEPRLKIKDYLPQWFSWVGLTGFITQSQVNCIELHDASSFALATVFIISGRTVVGLSSTHLHSLKVKLSLTLWIITVHLTSVIVKMFVKKEFFKKFKNVWLPLLSLVNLFTKSVANFS